MKNRREFLSTLAGTVAVVVVSPTTFAWAAEQFPSDITELYRDSVVIDTLCAPFAGADDMPDNPVVETVRSSGVTAINFTISAPTFDGTIENLAYIDALVEHWPDVFIVVRKQTDIGLAKREGKVGIMLGFQYTQFLESDRSRIELFRKLGVRIMQLTYNNRSIFGDGCLEPGNAGLSKAGIDAIHRMNELGVAVD